VNGVAVRRFPTVRGDGTFLVSPSLAGWLLRHATDYALIHAHSYHTPLPALAAMACIRGEVPLVVTPHFHGTGHTRRRQALHMPYRIAAAWMLRRADTIICVSAAERRLLHARFPVTAGKVEVIPNGVDPLEFSTVAPMPGRERRRTVLAVGRLEPYKGTVRLVRAARFLPGDTDLVLVGDGSDRQAVQAAVTDSGLDHRFQWYPSLSREELLAWYRRADVFVSMSRQEAFGITLLEAAMAGARVVASDIPPHREVAGYLPEGALSLVDLAANDHELAQAIIGAASEGPVTGAEDTVPTWRDVALRTRDVYDQVVARHSSL
jgi:glycosyltransferase involved in cell wall biosynthesis